LYELIKHLGLENVSDKVWKDIVDMTVNCTISLMREKNRLRVYLYDFALACFWLRVQDYGLAEISLVKLIRIAKKTLKRKITHGKILRIVALVRGLEQTKTLDPAEAIKKYIMMILDRMFKDEDFLRKKFLSRRASQYDVIDYKLRVARQAYEYLQVLPKECIIGVPRKVLGAVILYMAFRRNPPARDVVISSGDIEKYSGVCRFTILRKYKTLERVINLPSYNR